MSSLCRRLLLVGSQRYGAGLKRREVFSARNLATLRPENGPSWTEMYTGRRLYSSNQSGSSDDGAGDKIDPGLRLGDYPVLPWRSAQLNKQTGWWDNQDRRDKETPLHEEDDALNIWMFDAVENNGIYTRWDALAQLIAALAIMGLLIYLSYLYDAPSRNPAVPRQFPYDNLYLERGGDPDKAPTDQDRAEKIRATYGTEYSS